MLYAVLFEDAPDADPDIRKTHMPAHLSFLETHDDILSAGPLLDDEEQAEGGLWLVEADTARDVQNLVERDPLWPTGLRKSVRILRWKQVYAAGARRI